MPSIVQVNVSQYVAPTPATLQKQGAFMSHGGTDLAPGNYALLDQLSSLTPLLPSPAAIASLTWAGGVVSAVTSVPHQLPIGQSIKLAIAGAVPAGYNGYYVCAVTGASTFTYPLIVEPSSTSPATTPGTWVNYSASEITQMATTFFAQGASTAVYVIEMGAGSDDSSIAALGAYMTANPNSNYTPGAEGYFYSYLVPRGWNANVNFTTLAQSYESPTSKTYFFVTTTLATWQVYTPLQKCIIALIESPVYDVYPANSLTAISYSGGNVTATTTTAHGVSVGAYFTIAGCLPNGYNGTFLALPGTSGTTLVYAVPAALGTETQLGVLQANLYSNAGITSTEFSLAAPFWVSLHYAPSTTNRVTPFAFAFVYGVTPFPTQGQSSLLSVLKNANINVIGTGAEGGISNTILLWGVTLDGNDFTYWYSVDWVQITLDLNTSNAVINGSNNPINPLYYNQPGIDTLQAVAASTMSQGITYGLVLGTVTQTALDGPVLDANIDLGMYADQTVVNAVPFVPYSIENPSDYKIGRYAGLAVIYMPMRGFIQIVYNVLVTELIAY